MARAGRSWGPAQDEHYSGAVVVCARPRRVCAGHRLRSRDLGAPRKRSQLRLSTRREHPRETSLGSHIVEEHAAQVESWTQSQLPIWPRQQTPAVQHRPAASPNQIKAANTIEITAAEVVAIMAFRRASTYVVSAISARRTRKRAKSTKLNSPKPELTVRNGAE